MKYSWIITKDLLAEGSDIIDGNETGVYGPKEVERPDDLSGEKFQMYDDDGVLYYEGRFHCEEKGTEEMFGPLDDFGMPNAGCTAISYWNEEKEEWEIL